ncbi:MAG: hypothetical protein ACAH80_17535 [Alphaproteobacteria bacterium]
MTSTTASAQKLAQTIDAQREEKSQIIRKKAIRSGLWLAATAAFALFGAPALVPLFTGIQAVSVAHDIVTAQGARRALDQAKQQAAAGATDDIHAAKAKIQLPAFMSSVALGASALALLVTSFATTPALFICAAAVFVPVSFANSYLRGREKALSALAPDLPPSPPAPEMQQAPGRILNLRSPANDFSAKAAPKAAVAAPALPAAAGPQAPAPRKG